MNVRKIRVFNEKMSCILPLLKGKAEAMTGGIHDDLNFQLGPSVQRVADGQITGTQQPEKAMKGKVLSV
jgi:hypothetical protein